MAWTYNISTLFGGSGAEVLTTFGQLIFSGNYATGGDGAGTFVMGGNTINLPQYLQTAAFHATRAPILYNIAVDAGFFGFLVFPASGATAQNFKIKLVNSNTQVELAAGAYPAGLIAAADNHVLQLLYKLNL